MGIQIDGATSKISTPSFRYQGLDRKPSGRLPGTVTGTQKVVEARRHQAHGGRIRVHEERQRRDFEPLFRRGLEGQGRTGVPAYGGASRKSRANEIR